MRFKSFVGLGLGVLSTMLMASSVDALPPISQPVVPSAPPQYLDPTAPAANCIADRNFDFRTPGAAITGGVFNDYGVPGFFGGSPGSGTGGWVSGMALGVLACQ